MDVLFVNEPYVLERCIRLRKKKLKQIFKQLKRVPETKWTKNLY